MPSAARRCAGRVVQSRPSRLMRPSRDGTSPIRVRSVVVLPAPLRPIRATRPPGGTWSETRRRTATPARSTVTSSSRSIGARPNTDADHVAPDIGVGEDHGGRPKRRDPPLAPDRDAIGGAGDDIHIVLDEHGCHGGLPQHPPEGGNKLHLLGTTHSPPPLLPQK